MKTFVTKLQDFALVYFKKQKKHSILWFLECIYTINGILFKLLSLQAGSKDRKSSEICKKMVNKVAFYLAKCNNC